jgi:hypothetical protein
MPAILAGILIPHIICTLFILARIFSRVLLLRKWFIDDTLILLAWGFSTAVCVVYSIAAETPEILAVPDETMLQMQLDDDNEMGGSVHPYIMRTYLGLIFYQLCLCLTKLSILAFYLRMFSSRPKERYLAWGTVIFVILYGFPMLFMSIFQCHPEAGQFFGQPMQCFGFAPLLIASASLHTATDAWLILMIVPCISRLDLPPRQKIALAIVLSLSIFVIAASLVRLQLSLHRHFRPSSAGVTNTLAFFVMTILECDIALICASAPTLRPLMAKVFPKMMSEPQRRSAIDTETGSINLTVVSYHGYPWTEPATPLTRSKNGSIASHLNRLPPSAKMPVPPVPVLSAVHRTPTTLSLRSMLGAMTPRSRGRTLSRDERPILDKDLDMWTDRRGSAGLEIYHEHYAPSPEQKQSRSKTMHVQTHGLGHHRWGSESQESFVLGMNDPLSPHRLSPVSGLSGETCAVLGDAISLKGESIDGRMGEATENASRKDSKEMERDTERQGQAGK